MWWPKLWVAHAVECETLSLRARALGVTEGRLRDLADEARTCGDSSSYPDLLRREIRTAVLG